MDEQSGFYVEAFFVYMVRCYASTVYGMAMCLTLFMSW